MKPEGKATLAKAGQRKDAAEAISKAAKRAREERDGAAEASIKAANAAWSALETARKMRRAAMVSLLDTHQRLSWATSRTNAVLEGQLLPAEMIPLEFQEGIDLETDSASLVGDMRRSYINYVDVVKDILTKGMLVPGTLNRINRDSEIVEKAMEASVKALEGGRWDAGPLKDMLNHAIKAGMENAYEDGWGSYGLLLEMRELEYRLRGTTKQDGEDVGARVHERLEGEMWQLFREEAAIWKEWRDARVGLLLAIPITETAEKRVFDAAARAVAAEALRLWVATNIGHLPDGAMKRAVDKHHKGNFAYFDGVEHTYQYVINNLTVTDAEVVRQVRHSISAIESLNIFFDGTAEKTLIEQEVYSIFNNSDIRKADSMPGQFYNSLSCSTIEDGPTLNFNSHEHRNLTLDVHRMVRRLNGIAGCLKGPDGLGEDQD